MCILYIVIVILTLLDSKRKDLFKVMCILYIHSHGNSHNYTRGSRAQLKDIFIVMCILSIVIVIGYTWVVFKVMCIFYIVIVIVCTWVVVKNNGRLTQMLGILGHRRVVSVFNVFFLSCYFPPEQMLGILGHRCGLSVFSKNKMSVFCPWCVYVLYSRCSPWYLRVDSY